MLCVCVCEEGRDGTIVYHILVLDWLKMLGSLVESSPRIPLVKEAQFLLPASSFVSAA